MLNSVTRWGLRFHRLGHTDQVYEFDWMLVHACHRIRMLPTLGTYILYSPNITIISSSDFIDDPCFKLVWINIIFLCLSKIWSMWLGYDRWFMIKAYSSGCIIILQLTHTAWKWITLVDRVKAVWKDSLWIDHLVGKDHFPICENFYLSLDFIQAEPVQKDHFFLTSRVIVPHRSDCNKMIPVLERWSLAYLMRQLWFRMPCGKLNQVRFVVDSIIELYMH